MGNPINFVKGKVRDFADRHSVEIGLCAFYLGATLVANTAMYSVQAASEGVARLCGVQTTEHVGRLEDNSLREVMLPSLHGFVRTGTFRLEDGREMGVADGIVVTEGKFLQNMGGLEEGKKYNFRVFGNETIGYRFVDASEAGDSK